MYFELSIVMSSFSMSAISFTCPNRFRAPRVTSIAWCRKGHLFVLTIVHQRPRIYNIIYLFAVSNKKHFEKFNGSIIRSLID